MQNMFDVKKRTSKLNIDDFLMQPRRRGLSRGMKMTGVSKTLQFCKIHDGNALSFMCLTCSLLLCEGCLKHHISHEVEMAVPADLGRRRITQQTELLVDKQSSNPKKAHVKLHPVQTPGKTKIFRLDEDRIPSDNRNELGSDVSPIRKIKTEADTKDSWLDDSLSTTLRDSDGRLASSFLKILQMEFEEDDYDAKEQKQNAKVYGRGRSGLKRVNPKRNSLKETHDNGSLDVSPIMGGSETSPHTFKDAKQFLQTASLSSISSNSESEVNDKIPKYSPADYIEDRFNVDQRRRNKTNVDPDDQVNLKLEKWEDSSLVKPVKPRKNTAKNDSNSINESGGKSLEQELRQRNLFESHKFNRDPRFGDATHKFIRLERHQTPQLVRERRSDPSENSAVKHINESIVNRSTGGVTSRFARNKNTSPGDSILMIRPEGVEVSHAGRYGSSKGNLTVEVDTDELADSVGPKTSSVGVTSNGGMSQILEHEEVSQDQPRETESAFLKWFTMLK